jgi:multidrug resistance efflux pump
MQTNSEASATPLFRKEALRFQAGRLQGEVLLKIRSPWLVVGFTCAALAMAVLAAAAMVSHDRKELTTGALVSAAGTVRLASDRAARVGQIWVRDGDRVPAGQPLLSLIDAQGGQGVTLLAPADLLVGVLHASRGEEVTAGQPLIELLPAQDRIEAQLRLAPASVASIRRGQAARLRFDAFAHGRIAPIGGKIVSVSLMPAADGFYRANVALAQDHVQVAGESVALRPGMSFRCEVVIERRSLLQWLFAPLSGSDARP